ncbi:hypothetical protein DICPUDRAFT_81303 [Dictyostelium purpureum]|uniref:Sugar transporter SWEET n=1 Tax=Dictyostelium purpureum TaxID=5786 RepID=F0ZT32_DICPU|nr:uncharacterized protein DICPUDRAFT_81303 [Dictyostelium purpureum]EGC32889.1 hypothetical protein DICPUDRAFT_81303 [Dictyostelium purpureum]|eukprot:XP_003290574.1 hypothetical protein DICPUDRAFT_81303 [Dictyostelium purpureum]
MSVLAALLSILGNIISTGTAFSPLKKFLEIDRNRDVGSMNIYPIIALCGNSLCWVVYGTIIKNISIIPVNVIGLLITSYFIIVFISATSDLKRRRLVTGVYFGYLTALTVYHLLIIFYVSLETQKTIFGYTCNVAVLIFYGSPVLSLYGVIRSRDRSVINLPLALISCFAGIVWTFYGLLVKDKFIFLPNAIGASLSAISLVVYFGVGYFNTTQYKIPPNGQSQDGANQNVSLIHQDGNAINDTSNTLGFDEENKI